jgi:hypothetical protein
MRHSLRWRHSMKLRSKNKTWRKKIRASSKRLAKDPRWLRALKRGLHRPGVRESRSKSMIAVWANLEYKEKRQRAFTKKVKAKIARANRERCYHVKTSKHVLKYHRRVQKDLEHQGWKVINGGWPDFICTRGRQVRFIEVKAPYCKPSSIQQKVHVILQQFGIRVEILYPDNQEGSHDR